MRAPYGGYLHFCASCISRGRRQGQYRHLGVRTSSSSSSAGLDGSSGPASERPSSCACACGRKAPIWERGPLPARLPTSPPASAAWPRWPAMGMEWRSSPLSRISRFQSSLFAPTSLFNPARPERPSSFSFQCLAIGFFMDCPLSSTRAPTCWPLAEELSAKECAQRDLAGEGEGGGEPRNICSRACCARW